MFFVSFLLSVSCAMNPNSSEWVDQLVVPSGDKGEASAAPPAKRACLKGASASARVQYAVLLDQDVQNSSSAEVFKGQKSTAEFNFRIELYEVDNEADRNLLLNIYCSDRALWDLLDPSKHNELDKNHQDVSLSLSPRLEKNLNEEIEKKKNNIMSAYSIEGGILNKDPNEVFTPIFMNYPLLVKNFKILTSDKRIWAFRAYKRDFNERLKKAAREGADKPLNTPISQEGSSSSSLSKDMELSTQGSYGSTALLAQFLCSPQAEEESLQDLYSSPEEEYAVLLDQEVQKNSLAEIFKGQNSTSEFNFRKKIYKISNKTDRNLLLNIYCLDRILLDLLNPARYDQLDKELREIKLSPDPALEKELVRKIRKKQSDILEEYKMKKDIFYSAKEMDVILAFSHHPDFSFKVITSASRYFAFKKYQQLFGEKGSIPQEDSGGDSSKGSGNNRLPYVSFWEAFKGSTNGTSAAGTPSKQNGKQGLKRKRKEGLPQHKKKWQEQRIEKRK